MDGLDFRIIIESGAFLWQGFQVTLLLTLIGAVGGMSLGIVLAFIRMTAPAPVARLVFFYVNFCRTIPLLLIVFWFYFMVPLLIGRPVGGIYSVTVALVLFEAALFSEIFRTGIQAVGKGQLAAAEASGLTTLQAYRHVILPQGFRRMLPVLLTQVIILFQDTSLVYMVGVRDFLTVASIIAERESRIVELYLFVAIVYLVICVAASRYVDRLREKHA